MRKFMAITGTVISFGIGICIIYMCFDPSSLMADIMGGIVGITSGVIGILLWEEV